MKLSKEQWIDILKRAAWTFVEAVLLAVPISMTLPMTGAEWKAVLISAGMAGLSAVKTFVLSVIANNKLAAGE